MQKFKDYLLIKLHRWFQLPKPELVVVVRHGQSATNLLESYDGLSDETFQQSVLSLPDHKIPLTKEGERQAEATGIGIAKQYGLFDVVYHSDYLRTKQTLDGILKSYTPFEISSMKIRGNPKLGERQRGYLYDLTKEQIDELYPNFQDHKNKFGYFWTRPPGGESQFDVVPRVYDFIGEMFSHRPAQKVLIVCHGGVVRGIRYNLEKWSPDQYEQDAINGACSNCGVTTYVRDPKTNQLILKKYNQVYY